ncbi:MAG: hypothetical protein ACO3EZ_14465 [Prochlorotrichaceae cyanobacterium]
MTPTPLKTILSPTRYPFAVAMVRDGKISRTVAYPATVEDCYIQVQGWRSARPHDQWIMVEQREIGEKTPDRVNTYWVAV